MRFGQDLSIRFNREYEGRRCLRSPESDLSSVQNIGDCESNSNRATWYLEKR